MERIARIGSESTGIKYIPAPKSSEINQHKKEYTRQGLEDLRKVMLNVLSKSTIDSLEMNKFHQGEMFEDRRLIDAFICTDPSFMGFKPTQLTRDELRYAVNVLFTKLIQKFPVDYDSFKYDYWKTLNLFISVGNFDASICTKIGVHFFLYARTIQILGNEIQHRSYVERACRLQDFGSFALTEIAHGSNVQGCITTATFDVDSDSFIINTPNERGNKFWIGNAGQTANMSVVFANLIVNDNDYGIHAFIVPIRNPHNHHPMPGVTLVDCGDKMGLKGVDNGMITFRKVVVPRENLLNRVTQVDRQGNVTSLYENNSKRFAIQLSALSEGRVKVALASNSCAMQTCLIAIRYSAVRAQFGKTPDNETYLIDYPGWQDRIFPHFATNFVFNFGIRSANNLWANNAEKTFDSKNVEVKEMHSIISVVKSLATIVAQDAAQECRLATGGLGYSSYSKLPDLVSDSSVNITFEGDSHVLIQQTSKFLITQYMRIAQGEDCAYKSLSFLSLEPAFEHQLSTSHPDELLDLSLLETIFEKRCLRAIQSSVENLQIEISEGIDPLDAWNKVVPLGLNEAAILFGELYFLREAIKALNDCSLPQNKLFTQKIIQIYALSNLRKRSSSILGFISLEQMSSISIQLIKMYESIKYDIVAFYSECGFSDELLRSSIGSRDGNFYDRHLAQIQGDKDNFGRPSWWKDIWRIRNGEPLHP